MTIKLVLADDHPIVLTGLEQLLVAEADLAVLASCTDGGQALEAVARHRPDILLIDLKMPHVDGLTVIRRLREEQATCRIVVLTAALDDQEVLEAMRLGVRGVVLKEMAVRLLVQCIRKVYAGGTWVEQRSMSRALERVLQHEDEMHVLSQLLTPRELELLRLAAVGLTNSEIAERLCISHGTVKVHLHRIYEKLQVKNRTALALFAKGKGLA